MVSSSLLLTQATHLEVYLLPMGVCVCVWGAAAQCWELWGGFWERTKSDLVLYILEEMVMHTGIHPSVRQVRM